MVRKLLTTGPTGTAAWFERALDGASALVLHEIDALAGHWAELRERAAVAREASGLAELVRTQVDLLPETRAAEYSFVCDHGSTSTPTSGTSRRSSERLTGPGSANSSSRSPALLVAWSCGSRSPDCHEGR